MKKIVMCLLLVLMVLFVGFKTEKKNYLIVIDPGHGGYDGGAINGNVYEKDLTLEIGMLLKECFENIDISVIMTRESDDDLSEDRFNKKKDIDNRVKLINQSNADLFLCLHVNASPMKSLSGSQTFYFGNNRDIAEKIQEELWGLKNTSRKAKLIDDVYLLRNVNVKGCLVEVGFISNDKELQLLEDENYQIKLAQTIMNGTIKYMFD